MKGKVNTGNSTSDSGSFYIDELFKAGDFKIE